MLKTSDWGESVLAEAANPRGVDTVAEKAASQTLRSSPCDPMLSEALKVELETEIWLCLDNVTDPELDEPITEMGIVEKVEVTDARNVRIAFRLPSGWSAPSYAFLTAFVIRQALSALPWVRQARFQLNGHFFGAAVNRGINSGDTDESVFAQYCSGADLRTYVENYRAKAFARRQETVLLGLQALGYSAQRIVGMTLDELRRIAFSGEEEARQKPRYLESLSTSGLAVEPDDLAFVTWGGLPIRPDKMDRRLECLRGTPITMTCKVGPCHDLGNTSAIGVTTGRDRLSAAKFIADQKPPQITGGVASTQST